MSIKVENILVVGWEPAIRGMRNPMNSWGKSDSLFAHGWTDYYEDINGEQKVPTDGIGIPVFEVCDDPVAYIGLEDLKLMRRLAGDGPVHGKFMRMLTITMDITAPLYWWKEFDTYKVGTVANSCSTMHKIQAKEFTPEDFSHEHLLTPSINGHEYPTDLKNDVGLAAMDIDGHRCYFSPDGWIDLTCQILNRYRNLYKETGDKVYWWQMIQLLPSSYNQKRTVQFNYQVAKEILEYRRMHKLDEWRIFCEELLYHLPLSEELLEGREITGTVKIKESET